MSKPAACAQLFLIALLLAILVTVEFNLLEILVEMALVLGLGIYLDKVGCDKGFFFWLKSWSRFCFFVSDFNSICRRCLFICLICNLDVCEFRIIDLLPTHTLK